MRCVKLLFEIAPSRSPIRVVARFGSLVQRQNRSQSRSADFLNLIWYSSMDYSRLLSARRNMFRLVNTDNPRRTVILVSAMVMFGVYLCESCLIEVARNGLVDEAGGCLTEFLA